jgi:hypothetical protein
MNRLEFMRALDAAPHGGVVCYHTGFSLGPADADAETRELAQFCMQLYAEEGVIELIQRKQDRGGYEYLAVKREGNAA